MKRIALSVLIAGLALVFGSSEALAQRGHGRGRGGGPGGFGPGMVAELGLTGQQLDQLEALRAQADKQTAPLEAQLDSLRAKMHAAWSTPNPQQADILALQNQMEPLRDQLRQAKVELRLDIVDLLTPAQRTAYAEQMKARGPGKGKGHGNGHGKGQGKGFGCTAGQSTPNW